MKTEYLYVTIDPWGKCHRMADQRTERAILTKLLEEGWRPVRETPFAPGPNGLTAILICLEREPTGTMGFGFGP